MYWRWENVGTDTRTGIGAAVGGDSDNVVAACVDASGDAGSGTGSTASGDADRGGRDVCSHGDNGVGTSSDNGGNIRVFRLKLSFVIQSRDLQSCEMYTKI